MRRALSEARARLAACLGELGGAAPLGAVALLVANDRVGKPLFHDAVTGKLSDVAICFLLPLLVSAVLGLVVRWRAERRLWVGAAVGAVVFAALEMSDGAGAAFLRALAAIGVHGVLTRDPTDLAALACVPLAVAYGRRRSRQSPPHPARARLAGALALVGGSLALVATSAPERCGTYSAPVAFQVDGDCGPGGVIVVEADEFQGNLTITNPAALGLPSLITYGDPGTSARGRYDGTSCPYTFANGEWSVTIGACVSSADGGAASAGGPADGAAPDGGPVDAGAVDAGVPTCAAAAVTCQAALEGGVLWYTCGYGDPGDAGASGPPICRSRLTVLQ